MPLQSFSGDTFVAFIDITGFTAMMREGDGLRAMQALNDFYSVGYRTLLDQSLQAIRVDGLFISDCGILFVRGANHANSSRLEALLNVTESIHRLCAQRAVFLTTSIAWGAFSYEEKIDFPGIEKNPIYGNAYIRAYRDNSSGSPKIHSGECRITRTDLPQEITQFCENRNGQFASRVRAATKHFYFEWPRPPL